MIKKILFYVVAETFYIFGYANGFVKGFCKAIQEHFGKMAKKRGTLND